MITALVEVTLPTMVPHLQEVKEKIEVAVIEDGKDVRFLNPSIPSQLYAYMYLPLKTAIAAHHGLQEALRECPGYHVASSAVIRKDEKEDVQFLGLMYTLQRTPV